VEPNEVDFRISGSGPIYSDESTFLVRPVIHLDIKPGSCPNSFNPQSKGVLPVALLGTMNFDITMVDVSSVTISRADGFGNSVVPNEGPPGPHSTYGDVATPFNGELCNCHEEHGDGYIDLAMKFMSQDLVDALDLDTLTMNDEIELVLRGTLIDGTPFVASDCIRIVGQRFSFGGKN